MWGGTVRATISHLRAIIYRIRSPRAAYADVISGVLRNSGGCRYKACRYCGKTVSAGGLVYILPSGEVYHGKQDCSSLAYYVQKVRRSEVEYMGVCSYCGSG